jgi:tryptophanyl-tRNA synthetase
MTTTLSLLTPSGRLTLGNLLGALRPMAARQEDAYYGLSDLHAMTTPHDPALLRARTREMATLLLAAGLDRATLFRQSDVPAHTGLAHLLECTAHTGELGRMIQFKEKGRGTGSTRCSLFTYPVLMAADILLYRPTQVPVGDDQRQHVELARDVAIRFNNRCGEEVLVVPEHVIPPVGARIMDLQQPTNKMSKSLESPQGTILVLDPPEQIVRKVKRAVTDTANEVQFDPDAKPGVSNLLSILGAATGRDPEALADDYTMYGPLKADTADALVALLQPVQDRFAELSADPAATPEILSIGAEKARSIASSTLERAQRAVGLLRPA